MQRRLAGTLGDPGIGFGFSGPTGVQQSGFRRCTRGCRIAGAFSALHSDPHRNRDDGGAPSAAASRRKPAVAIPAVAHRIHQEKPMPQMPTGTACRLMTALCAAMVGGDCRAITQSRSLNANPASYCQTALPVFDGNVRKRPLAVQNEGNASAFVTCSFAAQYTPLEFVAVHVRNSSDAAATITCTGVTSGIGNVSPEYVTKTEPVPASGSVNLTWSGPDFAGAPASLPGQGLFSVSCSLAPDVGINQSFVLFHEDVGN
jgi:hypothetical protein